MRTINDHIKAIDDVDVLLASPDPLKKDSNAMCTLARHVSLCLKVPSADTITTRKIGSSYRTRRMTPECVYYSISLLDVVLIFGSVSAVAQYVTSDPQSEHAVTILANTSVGAVFEYQRLASYIGTRVDISVGNPEYGTYMADTFIELKDPVILRFFDVADTTLATASPTTGHAISPMNTMVNAAITATLPAWRKFIIAGLLDQPTAAFISQMH